MSDENKAVGKFLSGLEQSSSRTPRAQQKPQQRSDKSSRKPELQAVDAVLPNVLSRLGLDRRLKEHSLMQMWQTVAPAPIAERSRPLFIDSQHNLVVTVKDAAVAQEISLHKNQLVPQLSRIAKTLAIEFKGIRVDLKHYHKAQQPEEVPTEEPLPLPQESDLAEIHLSKYENGLIQDLSNKLEAEHSPPEAASRVLKTFERLLRLNQWRRLNGYPICRNCNNPVFRLHERGNDKLCFTCIMGIEYQI